MHSCKENGVTLFLVQLQRTVLSYSADPLCSFYVNRSCILLCCYLGTPNENMESTAPKTNEEEQPLLVTDPSKPMICLLDSEGLLSAGNGIPDLDTALVGLLFSAG